MPTDKPLQISRWFLRLAGTRIFIHHQDRIPPHIPLLVISNHRSFMDAPLLMAALERSIHFATHHYMGKVPVVNHLITQELGCFPIDTPDRRHHSFFQQTIPLLQNGAAVGIFPEGAPPMLHRTPPHTVGEFHRGFAHLALRAQIPNLAILPVAISSLEETTYYPMPTRILGLFDPTEPLFQQDGNHPVVIYHCVRILIGHPYWITQADRQSYHGKQGKTAVNQILHHTHTQIATLLSQPENRPLQ
ncbi:1-acyl-sn-glycerol-3-phosphate acyltransferase [[Phormidium] sp. ETS-05]|uniref:lysophospholipid acyltransferase family protein n=1 Tax=[Phormidium] sp. ETS-05 TaxID=222819 RepID=UPI0018EF07B4|nr:lysophospholipid acyltransferase family protein [[Phormidium] sp. ETS-05]